MQENMKRGQKVKTWSEKREQSRWKQEQKAVGMISYFCASIIVLNFLCRKKTKWEKESHKKEHTGFLLTLSSFREICFVTPPLLLVFLGSSISFSAKPDTENDKKSWKRAFNEKGKTVKEAKTDTTKLTKQRKAKAQRYYSYVWTIEKKDSKRGLLFLFLSFAANENLAKSQKHENKPFVCS